jgi:hypothetical protein
VELAWPPDLAAKEGNDTVDVTNGLADKLPAMIQTLLQGVSTDEPAALATAHPWQYDWQAAPRFDAQRDAALLAALRAALAGTPV